MAKCVYRIGTEEFDGYRELHDSLKARIERDGRPDGVLDLLFSEEIDRRGAACSTLDRIRMESKLRSLGTDGGDTPNGDVMPDVEVGEGCISARRFIDTSYFMEHGSTPDFRLDSEGWTEHTVRRWIASGKTPAQAADYCNKELGKWGKVCDDAAELHGLLIMAQTESEDAVKARADATGSFGGKGGAVFDLERNIFKIVNAKLDDPKIYANMSFGADLRNVPDKFKRIIGHADWLAVNKDGSIDVFNVVMSAEPRSVWSPKKIKHYRYEMAFLKRILAQNGVDVSKARTHIIPVQMEYDADFSKVERINLQSEAVESTDFIGNRYIGERYDVVCSDYVAASAPPITFTSEATQRANEKLPFIFPAMEVRAGAIALEAEDWVKRNWKSCRPRRRDDGLGYVLTIPETGESVVVSDTGTGAGNAEFVKWVSEKMSHGYESFTGSRSAEALKRAMEGGFISGRFETKGEGVLHSKWLRNKLYEYYIGRTPVYDKDGNRTGWSYKWHIIDSPELSANNMIAIMHDDTEQLDIIRVMMNDPWRMRPMREGRKGLLGAYIKDGADNFHMESTMGNIEAVTVAALLNEAAESLPPNVKLGKLKLISLNELGGMKGTTIPFDPLMREWHKIVRVVNRETGGKAGIVDHLREHEVGCMGADEMFVQMYHEILDVGANHADVTEVRGLNDLVEGYIDEYGDLHPGLIDAETVADKARLAVDLMRRIRTHLGKEEINVKDVEALCNNRDIESMTYSGSLVRLYMAAQDMLRIYAGFYVPNAKELTTLEDWIMRAHSISEPNYNIAVSMVQTTYNILDSRMTQDYSNSIEKVFEKFKKEKGYTEGRDIILGDRSEIYRNLFLYDENGNNTFVLKNPYDRNAELDGAEREFLKAFLWNLHKVRVRVRNGPNAVPEFSGPEDRALYENPPSYYFDVPLETASKLTRYADFKGFIKDKGETIVNAVKHPIDTLRKAYSELTDMSGIEQGEKYYNEMTVNNRFKLYEDATARIDRLAEKGSKWFETDLQNVFIDYLYEQNRCEEMDTLLYKINALEMGVWLQGLDYNDSKGIRKLLDGIDEYVKATVHQLPLMSKTGIIVDRVVRPLRKLVTEVLFGNNLYGFVRDNFYGVMNNFLTVASGFKTNISAASLAKAYLFVWRDGIKDLTRGAAIMKQMNLRYGFSLFAGGDMARKLKSGNRGKGVRGALFDWGGWMYWTMKKPDYLNRMVLFIGRLIEDNSFDAYGLDPDGNLTYDWHKDGRFDVLAKDDGTAGFYDRLSASDKEKYRAQKSKYFSLMKAFNEENPSRQLKMTDDLPDGYTKREIESLKTVAQDIYGSYDPTDANKLARMAIGRNFMFFFNFFNGITDIWFSARRLTERELREEQIYNEKGQPLYFDDEGNLTVSDTGMPATEMAAQETEGVVPSLIRGFKGLAANGWNLRQYWTNELKDDDLARRNYRRLLADMSMMAVFTLLYSLVVKPAYIRHKKEDDPERLVENICVELLYRGWSRSADFFSGPFALLKYFGDSTNPVTYDIGMKMVADVYKVLAGKQTFGATLPTYSAFYRSMQDSLRAYYKAMAQQDGTAMEEEARKREKEQRKGRTGTVK